MLSWQLNTMSQYTIIQQRPPTQVLQAVAAGGTTFTLREPSPTTLTPMSPPQTNIYNIQQPQSPLFLENGSVQFTEIKSVEVMEGASKDKLEKDAVMIVIVLNIYPIVM